MKRNIRKEKKIKESVEEKKRLNEKRAKGNQE